MKLGSIFYAFLIQYFQCVDLINNCQTTIKSNRFQTESIKYMWSKVIPTSVNVYYYENEVQNVVAKNSLGDSNRVVLL